MQIAKILLPSGKESLALVDGEEVAPITSAGGQFQTLTDLLEADDPASILELLAASASERIPSASVSMLPPIDQQEVWAAGVTYTRSRKARMDESEGAASFYDKVYEAERPELFFKSMPYRVVGPDHDVRIRRDARWNVPEPELALVINSRMELVGFTIGNDVSSRDIEGENPLYLPQAKVYDQSCALGPCITLRDSMPGREQTGIHMAVVRKQEIVFEGTTNAGQMARSFQHLIGYLGRDNTFRNGVILLTGTGIVPGDDFTLRSGDTVQITIDGIGTLVNRVAQG